MRHTLRKTSFLLTALALPLSAGAAPAIPLDVSMPFETMQTMTLKQAAGAGDLFLARLKLPNGSSCMLNGAVKLSSAQGVNLVALPGTQLKCEGWLSPVMVKGYFPAHGWQPRHSVFCAASDGITPVDETDTLCVEHGIRIESHQSGAWVFTETPKATSVKKGAALEKRTAISPANLVATMGQSVPFELLQDIAVPEQNGASDSFEARVKLAGHGACVLRGNVNLFQQYPVAFEASPPATLQCPGWRYAISIKGRFPAGFPRVGAANRPGLFWAGSSICNASNGDQIPPGRISGNGWNLAIP